MLSSSREQDIFEDCRVRGQDQGLQNVYLRPRTSLMTPPLFPRYLHRSLYNARPKKTFGAHSAQDFD